MENSVKDISGRELRDVIFDYLDNRLNRNKPLKYFNGNYFVELHSDGTKIKRALRKGEEFSPEFPDSIDLKITDRCDIGCKFCHESSTTAGKKFNLTNTIQLLNKLPKCGIEVAIGGGDVFTCPSDLSLLVDWLLKNNFSPRLTLNYQSLVRWINTRKDSAIIGSMLSNMSRGAVGISLTDIPEDFEDHLGLIYKFIDGERVVFHIIAGIFPPDKILKLKEIVEDKSCYTSKILILGYKSFGRAQGTTVDLVDWKKSIKQIIYDLRTNYIGTREEEIILGFDNLALEQLDIESSVFKEDWAKLYNGDEFTSSMYVDAVEETFAPTSRSPLTEREKWCDYNTSIVDYFKKKHK